jgi:hypothetical protein
LVFPRWGRNRDSRAFDDLKTVLVGIAGQLLVGGSIIKVAGLEMPIIVV